MKAYRVVTSDPDGIAIGFDPRDHWPSNSHLEADEYDLATDGGGDKVFIHGTNITISHRDQINGQYPEPDLLVWRTPADFETWVREIFGEADEE